MKLEKKYLAKCYHDAMILQYKKVLVSSGFTVELEKRLQEDGLSFDVDLFASKDEETRVYEFKLIGDKRRQTKHITRFKEIAEKIGAKPYVVYVNPPTEKNIEIEDLGNALCSYIEGDGIPSVLDSLSTHTSIGEIEIDNLTYIYVSPDSIKVEGEAIISVHLQYGSDSDEELEASINFPMEFKAELDFELSVIDIEYSIDTSSWDE